MKRLATFVTVLIGLLAAGAALAEVPSYGWTVSASSSDPFVNEMPYVPGIPTVYLWFACSIAAPAGPGGMAAAEFALCTDNPGNLVLAMTPMNGFLNAGTPTQVLLAVGGCPTGPVVAAEILLMVNTPGRLCLCPSDANGYRVTVDCSQAPTIWAVDWVGFDFGSGSGVCQEGWATCSSPTSVETSSWGTIKSLYR